MEQGIFGIKINGASYSVTVLSIDDSQESFDYICNFALEQNSHGNGNFRILFRSPTGESGLQLGKWRILNGRLGFDWGGSVVSFVMEDECGETTEKITAGSDKGSASGWDEERLLHSLITKAQSIAENYPSSCIYNVHQALRNSKPSESDLIKYRTINEDDELIDFFEKKTVNALAEYLKCYHRFEALLKDMEDIRGKRLLNEARKECMKVINIFR